MASLVGRVGDVLGEGHTSGCRSIPTGARRDLLWYWYLWTSPFLPVCGSTVTRISTEVFDVVGCPIYGSGSYWALRMKPMP